MALLVKLDISSADNFELPYQFLKCITDGKDHCYLKDSPFMSARAPIGAHDLTNL